MKSRLFLLVAVVLTIGACKAPYKATDNPSPATDSTASATDTSAAAKNKMPASTDSTSVSKMDSVSQALQDSANVSSPTDSVQANPVTDSAMATPELDSTNMQSATDSVNTTPSVDSLAKNTEAPAAVETAFIKQYPGATKMVWSMYDSLAAVPIDMRLTGWKKMDTEDYMVQFDLKDEDYYAWYDSNGKWIGSASPMKDFTKLPAAVNTAVNNAIKKRYTEYNISQVNREFQTGKKSYEVELTKGDDKVRTAGKITQIFKYAADKKE